MERKERIRIAEKINKLQEKGTLFESNEILSPFE
jgi:hypothetical protein